MRLISLASNIFGYNVKKMKIFPEVNNQVEFHKLVIKPLKHSNEEGKLTFGMNFLSSKIEKRMACP